MSIKKPKKIYCEPSILDDVRKLYKISKKDMKNLQKWVIGKFRKTPEEPKFPLQWVKSNKISVVFDGARWAFFRNDFRADSRFVSLVEVTREIPWPTF